MNCWPGDVLVNEREGSVYLVVEARPGNLCLLMNMEDGDTTWDSWMKDDVTVARMEQGSD